jgi:hypothetical protein
MQQDKSGGAKKKRKDRVKLSSQHKTEVPTPLNANAFFIFESHPIYDQTQGSSVVLFSLLYREFYYLYLMTRPSCKVI